MATSTNTIPYWGLFTNQNYFDYNPTDTAAGQQFLEGIRKIDPNATFVPVSMGENNQPYYRLQYDAKAPGIDLNTGDYAPLTDPNATASSGGGNFQTDLLKDPNAVSSSSTWGNYTSPDNVTPQGADWLTMLGPAAVLGSVFAFPALAGAMSGGAIGGAAGAAAAPLDTSNDFYLGLTDQGYPAFQGVPSTGLLNAPLGSAESSLYGTAAQTAPEAALGAAGTQAAAPITDLSTTAGLTDQIRNLLPPGVGDLLGKVPGLLGKIPGLLGSGTGGGSGGGGVGLIGASQKSPYSSLLNVLQQYYGKGARNGL